MQLRPFVNFMQSSFIIRGIGADCDNVFYAYVFIMVKRSECCHQINLHRLRYSKVYLKQTQNRRRPMACGGFLLCCNGQNVTD